MNCDSCKKSIKGPIYTEWDNTRKQRMRYCEKCNLNVKNHPAKKLGWSH